MSSSARPSLAYVVPCDAWGTIERVVAALEAQTIADEIELVVVGPTVGELRPPPGAASRLAGVTVVEADLLPLGEGRLAGVGAAKAAIVALGETHTFPASTWAERLVVAAADGAAALAPRIVPAAQSTALSWAALAMDYGRWQQQGTGPIGVAPGYNAVWRRDVLLAEAGGAPALLAPGCALSDQLRSHGHRLERCGDAEIAHLSVDRPGHWIVERCLAGHLLAASRARSWSRWRRLMYAVAAPLLAVVVAGRTLRTVRGLPRPRGGTAAVAVGSIVWAAGEAVGYIAGLRPGAEAAMLEYELHKARYAREVP